MLEELGNASRELRVALARYLRVSSSIQALCPQSTTPHDLSSAYSATITQELDLIELYDKEIQQAKLAIRMIHNYALHHAPINRLPSEILLRIFHVVHASDPCRTGRLALVCSHWRSVALGSPLLWSHIDYHPDSSKWSYPGLCARVELHVSRSGEMPLDVHVSVAREIFDNNHYDQPICTSNMCKVVGPRMRSLELEFPYGSFDKHRVGNVTNYLITNLFRNCTMGRFTKLVTDESEFFGFLVAESHLPPGAQFLKLGLHESDLEAALASITVLQLHGVFPVWTSQAYHGLVDLRLLASGEGVDSISESQLIGILEASPRLRILHFDLVILDGAEGDTSTSRVLLNELEVLYTHAVYDGYSYDSSVFGSEDLLRLIQPGLGPLRFSVRCFDFPYELPALVETRAFFARTTITKLYLSTIPEPIQLLPSAPFLKVLVLEHCPNLGQLQPLGSTGQHECDSHPAYPQLDLCVIIDCSLAIEQLAFFVRQCRVRTLTIYNSTLHRNNDPETLVGIPAASDELSVLCSDIRFPNVYPVLDEHGDLFE